MNQSHDSGWRVFKSQETVRVQTGSERVVCPFSLVPGFSPAEESILRSWGMAQ